MVNITNIVITDKFQKDVKKIRDKSIRQRMDVEVNALRTNPESGKP